MVAQGTTDANRKSLQAIRLETAPKVDGDHEDVCWQNCPEAGSFVTFSPSFGQASAEKTIVKIAYTDEAIYVAAYMYMREPEKLRTDLSLRDGQSAADQFHIGFDTYRDRQNAFRFELSASGVQRDLRMSPGNFDPSWDAVWQGKVKVQVDGWSLEMRIPFSALRIPKQDEQVWGLQCARFIQYTNEFSTWSPVDPNGNGTMPQWGDLGGLKNLKPPLRLAFSPYVAGAIQRAPISDEPRVFANSTNVNGGLDVKWGVNESFTLDATLIPNFGETQSDNLVRNLSPFEVVYEERRQFFTEGSELFGKGDIFYSRRIGGRPARFFEAGDQLVAHEVLLKNPAQQALYNATKFSGRTRSNLGIGVLNAVAAPAFAHIRNDSTNLERTFQTDALTNYNVVVLDQVLAHNSSITFTNGSVLREGGGADANISSLATALRSKNNMYEFQGLAKLSQTFSQNSVNRGGWLNASYGRITGLWTWRLGAQICNATYDQSDLAPNIRNNFNQQTAELNYFNAQPKGKLLYKSWNIVVENTFLQAPFKWEALEISSYFETMTQKQKVFGVFFLSRPFWYYDFYEPRLWGKQYYHAPFVFFSPQITTDRRKKLFCQFEFNFGESPIKRDPYIGIGVKPTWILNPHIRLTGNLNVTKDHSNFGFVNKSNPEDIVFGRRDITTFNNDINVAYLFGPRMNLTLRARHYWNKLYYHEYLHLQEDGTFKPFPEYQGSSDENFNQFNIDFVYTWQFAPGSFLNLIWKDAIFAGDGERYTGFAENFRKTIQSPHDNTITLKLIYWLDAGRF